MLPVAELAECARAVLERDGERVLNYGPIGGYPPLREAIAARHGVDPASVLVLNGSLQGLALLVELLAPNGPVLVEAPTYDRPLKLLAMRDCAVRPVRQNADGLDLDALESELDRGARPSFLYTIPTFQNPSGRTLPLESRKRLVALARDRGLLVLEDDPYGLVRFSGEALPTLWELDGGDNVVYSSSFSKTVAPGLRVGYLVVPEALRAQLEARALQTYLTPALLGQAAIHEFMARGLFEPNVERVCGLLRERRDAMVEALGDAFGGAATWSTPEGGYFLWLDLPDDVDAAALLPAAEASGVTYVPGSDFFIAGGGGGSAIRLAYSYVAPAAVREGVARLASAVALPAPV